MEGTAVSVFSHIVWMTHVGGAQTVWGLEVLHCEEPGLGGQTADRARPNHTLAHHRGLV